LIIAVALISAGLLKVHRCIFSAAVDLDFKLEAVAFVERRDTRALDG
jgi:hypothetical protein